MNNRFSVGKVTGRYVSSLMDAVSNPVPATGTITFTPQAEYIITPEEKTTLSAPIIAVLDAQGYLSTAETSRTTQRYMRDIKGGYIPKSRGVNLQATDGDTNPTGWTWKVEFNLTIGDHKVKQEPFSFSLPAGETVDLTTVTPVPGVSGYSTTTGPKGDSVRFLPEQDLKKVEDPTNGDIVPVEGSLYGYTDGKWVCLTEASTTAVSASSSALEVTGADSLEAVEIPGGLIVLSGTVSSDQFVLGSLQPEFGPKKELSFPISSTDGATTSTLTVFQNGSFQVPDAGTFSISVSYLKGSA